MLVPEDDVVGGERLTIRPFGALAQEDGDLGAIIADLPAFSQIGHQLGELIRIPEE